MSTTIIPIEQLTSQGLAEKVRMLFHNIHIRPTAESLQLCREGESVGLVAHFLDRLYDNRWIAAGTPRIDPVHFIAAFVARGHPEVVEGASIEESLLKAADDMTDTVYDILHDLIDGKIQELTFVTPERSELLSRDVETYRTAFVEFRRMDDINSSILILLAMLRAYTPMEPTDMSDRTIETIAGLMRNLTMIVVETPVTDLSVGVCVHLANFTRSSLSVFEGVQLGSEEHDEDIDLVSEALRSRLALLDARIAAFNLDRAG